jgi:aromatic ring hydroxylase
MMRHKMVAGLVVAVFLSVPVFASHAHQGEAHASVAETEMHVISVARMQQIVALLTQVVALLQEKRALEVQMVAAPQPKELPKSTAATSQSTTTPTHTQSATAPVVATSTPIATFAIEVEEHDGKTHVHARYVDKQEAMFFVDASIDDEAALVAAISAYTGLPALVVKPALVYLGH